MSNKKAMRYQRELQEVVRVEGNIVRKLSAVPKREQEHIHRVKRQPAKAPARRVNPLSVIVTVGLMLAMLGICVGYLNLHSENSRVRSSITSLQTEVDTLKAQNDSLDYSINTYVDLSYVANVAENELGMKRITKDQINIYDSAEYEYMQKFADIPN